MFRRLLASFLKCSCEIILPQQFKTEPTTITHTRTLPTEPFTTTENRNIHVYQMPPGKWDDFQVGRQSGKLFHPRFSPSFPDQLNRHGNFISYVFQITRI